MARAAWQAVASRRCQGCHDAITGAVGVRNLCFADAALPMAFSSLVHPRRPWDGFLFARGNVVLGWFGVLLRATNERTEGGPLKRSTRSTR